MIKNLLFLFAGLILVSSSYAQTSTQKSVVGNSEYVKQTPVLKSLSEKVNTAYVTYSNSATASRTSAEQAKTDYYNSLAAYQRELEAHLLSADKKYTEELKSEIALVKQLQGGSTTSTR